MYDDPSILESLSIIAVAVILVVMQISEWLDSDVDPVEQAKREYERGEIPLRELERRMQYHLDDRNAEIERVATEVGGIGPAIAENIAREFDSVHDLEQAAVDELARVNGVGESRARDLYAYLHDDTPTQQLADAAASDRLEVEGS